MYVNDGNRYQKGETVQVAEKDTVVADTAEHHIKSPDTLQHLGLDEGQETKMSQTQIKGDRKRVAEDIAEYWNQFWQKDTPVTDCQDESWTQTEGLLLEGGEV